MDMQVRNRFIDIELLAESRCPHLNGVGTPYWCHWNRERSKAIWGDTNIDSNEYVETQVSC